VLDYGLSVAAKVRIPVQAACACVGAFALVLLFAYAVPVAERADGTALNGLMTLRGPRISPILEFFAHSANPGPGAAILAAIVILSLVVGRRREALAAAALVGGATLTTEVLKMLLAHQRLEPTPMAHQLGAPAFPSGHATGAMALALAAVLVAGPRLRPLAVGAGAVYAIAVSTSILILGWHFPSDVFGGMLVAAFYFCLAVAALRAFAGREEAGASMRWARLRARRWREIAAIAVLVGAVVVAARAEAFATYASAHTTATVIALAVVGCSAALLRAAAALADR
jgi:membrane-associated phospholipid phosphatase